MTFDSFSNMTDKLLHLSYLVDIIHKTSTSSVESNKLKKSKDIEIKV